MKVVFMGTPEFSVPVLRAIAAQHEVLCVYCQPPRPAGRGTKDRPSPVQIAAEELGLTVRHPVSLRSEEAQHDFAALQPDVAVVVAYGLILPQPILDAPNRGCLNIHASLLPRWRGAAPIQRAILAGDERTGVTVMQMDAGLDTGPMLLTRETPIGPREDGGMLHDRLAVLGAGAIVAAIEQWQAGRVTPQPQPAEGVTYASKIRKDEARIDWTRPATELDRLVRAFHPWPVAETTWQGRQLRVWQAEPEPRAVAAEPGRVIEAAAGRIVVATGDGALRLARVQLAGRRATTAAEFLNAHSLAGATLG